MTSGTEQGPRRDPTRRFSDRVEAYERYRPSYPPELIDVLRLRGFLDSGGVIADVGSGTGKLSRLFLERGHRVIGVEPNAEMRAAGERQLEDLNGFESVPGRAEATTLPDRCVDLVVCGQAGHWFDLPRAREEFERVLRPPHRTVLVWNDRNTEVSKLMAGYERLLDRCGTDYRQVNHQRFDDARRAALFAGGVFDLEVLSYRQVLDLAAFEGRLVSSSYVPVAGEPGHAEILTGLRELFDTHNDGGLVTLEYETRIYMGQVG